MQFRTNAPGRRRDTKKGAYLATPKMAAFHLANFASRGLTRIGYARTATFGSVCLGGKGPSCRPSRLFEVFGSVFPFSVVGETKRFLRMRRMAHTGDTGILVVDRVPCAAHRR